MNAIAKSRRCKEKKAVLNPSFRDGALAPDPESRDSGFDASHRPGMTGDWKQRNPVDSCALLIRLRVLFSIKDFAVFPWLVDPVQT